MNLYDTKSIENITYEKTNSESRLNTDLKDKTYASLSDILKTKGNVVTWDIYLELNSLE